MPAELLDLAHDAADRVADDELDLLGVEVLAERRRADDVGEEGADDFPFLADGLLGHATYCDARLGGGDGSTSRSGALSTAVVASTTAGSNCVPALARSSASASSCVRAAR